MSLKLYILPAGPIGTNAYLLLDAERGEAVLIDAPGDIWAELEPIMREEECRLTELWLTHGHWDHMQGAAEVIAATGAKVSAHAADKILLETPGVMEVFLPSQIRLTPITTDRWVAEGDRLSALGHDWEVRHVPGHCPGSVVYWCASEGVAFSGDAILSHGVGRTDFPGGTFEMLENSIRTRIYTLPDETVLYPGHGDPTCVGDEKKYNRDVRDNSGR